MKNRQIEIEILSDKYQDMGFSTETLIIPAGTWGDLQIKEGLVMITDLTGQPTKLIPISRIQMIDIVEVNASKGE